MLDNHSCKINTTRANTVIYLVLAIPNLLGATILYSLFIFCVNVVLVISKQFKLFTFVDLLWRCFAYSIVLYCSVNQITVDRLKVP